MAATHPSLVSHQLWRSNLAPIPSSCLHSSLPRRSVSRTTQFLRPFLTRIHAKFEQFQDDIDTQPQQQQLEESTNSTVEEEREEEDDSCLPSDLVGAVRQSGQASATFVSSGGMRAIVELLIPQLQFLDDEGAQGELWELSRIFIDTLIEETGCQRVKAVFPDAGAAALLKYRWQDAAFSFSSLSDRKAVQAEDEIVVMVVPDYQMLEYVERIASDLSDDPPRPLIMWNPRLVSEDVGVGFNVRKLRRYFLRLWKVFYDDRDRANRYRLAKEQISRPDAEELDVIFGNVEEKLKTGGPNSLFEGAAGIFSSLGRFLRIISK